MILRRDPVSSLPLKRKTTLDDLHAIITGPYDNIATLVETPGSLVRKEVTQSRARMETEAGLCL